MNRKALEQRTALAVSVWSVPLSPLGFSASNLSGVGAVPCQSGRGYILPVWPSPRVSSDGATVSPDPSGLSLPYLCCNSLCVGGLGSVCYIWSISPVLSGVLCDFKYALSNSLSLSQMT